MTVNSIVLNATCIGFVNESSLFKRLSADYAILNWMRVALNPCSDWASLAWLIYWSHVNNECIEIYIYISTKIPISPTRRSFCHSEAVFSLIQVNIDISDPPSYLEASRHQDCSDAICFVCFWCFLAICRVRGGVVGWKSSSSQLYAK